MGREDPSYLTAEDMETLRREGAEAVSQREDKYRGLYGKYRVERVSDPTGKHDNCWYFVLDPEHDPYALVALRAYADACREEYPTLAHDLDVEVEARS